MNKLFNKTGKNNKLFTKSKENRMLDGTMKHYWYCKDKTCPAKIVFQERDGVRSEGELNGEHSCMVSSSDIELKRARYNIISQSAIADRSLNTAYNEVMNLIRNTNPTIVFLMPKISLISAYNAHRRKMKKTKQDKEVVA